MINKSTRRDAVLSVLKSTVSHPTAEWIYEQTKKVIPNISLGTVYRNLNDLIKAGLVIKVQGVFEKDRYDANYASHFHLVCESCGGVIDYEPSLPLNLKLGNDKDCLVKDYSLVYYGLCPKCNKNIKNEKES